MPLDNYLQRKSNMAENAIRIAYTLFNHKSPHSRGHVEWGGVVEERTLVNDVFFLRPPRVPDRRYSVGVFNPTPDVSIYYIVIFCFIYN